ncbi:MAG: metallophosphoesterase [Deltaproteobacteria bacterium]|nr:metallophosphoesterase [Deltaproteobacteria bacterium]
MTLAIISDTNFGDGSSVLFIPDNQGNPVIGPKYLDLKNAVGTDNDYLVLAGDILDFSVAPYEKAYQYAQAFFLCAQADNLAKEYIYLAGNHDADIWHIVQHQRSVINKLLNGKLPESYQHSVPGIIDDRTGGCPATKGLTLYGVTPNAKGPKTYGGMFLDKIAPGATFNFVYPNLYIVTDNECVLVTHGQYLEPYWAVLGEVATKIAGDDLKVGAMDVREMVEINFPLNQLGCTGIGQAGVLTRRLVRPVEVEVKAGKLDRVKKYLDRLGRAIDDLTDYGWLKKFVVDCIVKGAAEEVIDTIGKIKKTRYRDDFIYDRKVQDRFKRFYDASLLELGAINASPDFRAPDCRIPAPERVIFGHTHQPIPWNDPSPPKFSVVSSASPKRLTLHNTGGWLTEDDKFVGAEVFKYDTKSGFSSISI